MKKIILRIIYHILSKYAKDYLQRTKPYIIGITGNVGKTSMRMILYKVLQKHLIDKNIYTSPKNFNSELGFVFSIFKIENFKPGIISLLKLVFKIKKLSKQGKQQYDIIILEYGIDHPMDMDFLIDIAKPDISICTKLGTIHIEFFKDEYELWDEELKLVFATKNKTYLNIEDDYSRKIYEKINIDKKYFNNIPIEHKYIQEGKNIYSELKFDGNLIKTNCLGGCPKNPSKLLGFFLFNFFSKIKNDFR